MEKEKIREKLKEMRKLVDELKYHCDLYYKKDAPVITNEEYDAMYEKLEEMEKETGIILPDSPTANVGNDIDEDSPLRRVRHTHLMLSMDKTKDAGGVVSLLKGEFGIAMLKADGLTLTLRYENGQLVGAETRGNGTVGEDVLHNAKVIDGIPNSIRCGGTVEIDGEVICDYETFEKNFSQKYKNPRNFASGGTRLPDANECAERMLTFLAWDVINGYPVSDNEEERLSGKLGWLENIGFLTVPYVYRFTGETLKEEGFFKNLVENIKERAVARGIPYDGIVFKIDSVKKFKEKGQTGHHFKGGIAFKFYDETEETNIRDVEWTMGKTGVLTPTAVFDPVEIDGTTVERASVHNVSNLESLALAEGDRITVYKANMIIPQIDENLDRDNSDRNRPFFTPPAVCPICGQPTEVKTTGGSGRGGIVKILYCTNRTCEGKLLGRCAHFVSREAMDIVGLSENTLSRLIDAGYINDFIDIYSLWKYKDDIAQMEGFGKKSAENIVKEIEKKRSVTIDRFLYALCIPLIGRKASKIIAKKCGYDYNEFERLCDERFAWSGLDDFGEFMEQNLYKFYEASAARLRTLASLMNFEKPEETESSVSSSIAGKTFVITGKVYHFANRGELQAKIESLGGKAASSVTSKTDYLINNDTLSASGKNKKAAELGIPVISEEDFMKMAGI